MLGSPRPVALATLGALAPASVLSPFETELNENKERQLWQVLLVLGVGATLGVVLIIAAIAAQKLDSWGALVNCSSRACLNWADLDFFFAKQHVSPNGGIQQNRKTSFGGQMTVICVFFMITASLALGMQNLSIAYVESVSTATLPWQPLGAFSVRVEMRGGGMDACVQNASTIGTVLAFAPVRASDWSAPSQSTFEYNAADGTCVATWTCSMCTMRASVSTSVLLNVSARAWVTHASYTLVTPSLTASALPSAADASADACVVQPARDALGQLQVRLHRLFRQLARVVEAVGGGGDAVSADG